MDKIKEILSLVKENQKYAKLGAVIIIIIAALLVFGLKGENDTIQLTNGEAEKQIEQDASNNNEGEKVETTSSNRTIYVDVSGEVNKPGVYKIKEGERIYQVIDKAGGLSKDADTSNINQAEVASDGQKIIIPKTGDVSNDTQSENQSNTATSQGGKININTADSSKLQELTGVGPATADKIISYRESNGNFKTTEDLKNVSGIGDKTFEKLKDKITV